MKAIKLTFVTVFVVSAALFSTSCTSTPTSMDSAYLPAPGQTPREFIKTEQRPFVAQQPSASQIQAAQSGISVPAP